MRALDRLFATGTTAGLADGALLARFLERHDPSAFEALVARHGPMVLAVCRGVLRDPDAADDAFQATFLVLVKKARSLRRTEALGPWLHRVARRAATRAARGEARRRSVEAEAGAMVAAAGSGGANPWDDLRPALHDEIARLPDCYRSAVVLCDLEGVPQAEAAAQLRWSERTLRRRLASARSLLGERLGRRRFGPAAAPLPLTALLAREARTAVSVSCLEATVRAATVAAANGSAAGAAGLLAEEVIRAMWLTKLKLAAAVAVGLGAAAWTAGAALIGDGPDAAPPPPVAVAVAVAVASAAAVLPLADAPEPGPDAGATMTVHGRVVDPAGKPVPGATVYFDRPAEYPKRQDSPRATAGADGRFTIDLDRAAVEVSRNDGPWQRPSLGAAAPGYAPAWVDAEKAGPGDLELRLVADDVPVRGRLLDPQGRPVAGATVKVTGIETLRDGAAAEMLKDGVLNNAKVVSYFGAPWSDPPTLTTGADGRFEVRGVGRDRLVMLEVAGPGLERSEVHALAHVTAVAPPPPPRPDSNLMEYRHVPVATPVVAASFDHVVGPTKPITGVVRSKATGKPVAGVKVYANVRATRSQANGETDAEGRFRLVGLRKGDVYDVHASPAAGLPVLGAEATLRDTEGLKPLEVDLLLPGGVPLHGRLVDKVTGEPVPVGNVSYVKPLDNLAEGQGTWSSPPTSGAEFTLSVPPGRGLVAVNVRGRNASYTRARLDPADKGKGIGSFEDGETLRFPMDAYNAYKFIDVPADAKDFAVTLEANPGPTRRGRLVDPDGKPVVGAQAYGLTGDWQVRTLETADFRILGVETGHDRVVAFTHRARRLAGSVVVPGPGDEPMTVTMAPCGAAVGRLVDEDGLPMAGVRLRSVPNDGEGKRLPIGTGFWPEGEHVRSDADGRFRIDGINPTLSLTVDVEGPYRSGFYLRPDAIMGKLKARPGETVDLGEVHAKYVPQ